MFVYILNLPVDVKINMEVGACAETGFYDIRSGIVYGKKRAAAPIVMILRTYGSCRKNIDNFVYITTQTERKIGGRKKSKGL